MLYPYNEQLFFERIQSFELLVVLYRKANGHTPQQESETSTTPDGMLDSTLPESSSAHGGGLPLWADTLASRHHTTAAPSQEIVDGLVSTAQGKHIIEVPLQSPTQCSLIADLNCIKVGPMYLVNFESWA